MSTDKDHSFIQLIASDTYSLSLLQPLLIGHPFLPFSGASLRPFCLVHMLNDILINQRQNIVEFGSGLSTILIGRLIKTNKLKTRLLTFEHEEGLVIFLNSLLEKENLNEAVKIIYAPLTASPIALNDNKWLDLNILDKHTNGLKFDMVIVDGPPAWEPSKEKARYPALKYIIDKLNDRFSVYLDDADRPGEKYVINKWQQEFGLQFKIAGGSLAYCCCGNSYYTEPIAYY